MSRGVPAHDSPVDDPSPREQQLPAERIIEAALGLIAEHGLGGVTMTSVAEAAGVARQTLYNHYRDVDSIVGAVIERHNEESLRRLRAVLATVDAPADRLEHLVRHIAAIRAHAHPTLGFQYGLSAGVQATLRQYDDAIRALIAEILQDGIDRADFRGDLHPARDARLIQRLLDGVGELAADERANAAQVVATATRTLLAAVAAPEAGDPDHLIEPNNARSRNASSPARSGGYAARPSSVDEY